MLQLSPYYKIISLVLTGVSFKTANVRMDVKYISMLSNFMNATPITFYKILCTTMKNDFKNSPEACVLVHWQKQLHAGVNIKTLSPIYVPHMYISVLKMYTARRSSFRVHFPRSPITVMPVVSVGERRTALHVDPPFTSSRHSRPVSRDIAQFQFTISEGRKDQLRRWLTNLESVILLWYVVPGLKWGLHLLGLICRSLYYWS